MLTDLLSDLGHAALSPTGLTASLTTMYGLFRQRAEILPHRFARNLPKFPAPTATDRILVVSPHPDDETLAAGGYLAAAVAAGATVRIVICTDRRKPSLRKRRRRELRSALETIGLHTKRQLVHLSYPDGELTQTPGFAADLARQIAVFKPTRVFAPYLRERHRDHQAAGKAAYESWKAAAPSARFSLSAYLIHYPPFYPWPRRQFHHAALLPPYRLYHQADLTWYRFPLPAARLRQKAAAVETYRSQLRNPVLRPLMRALVRRNELFAAYA